MSTGSCALCGGTDPLGLGICPACGPAPGTADAVVFVDRSSDRGARGQARDALTALFGDTIGSAARRVADGRRPLIRLPRGLADRATRRLAEEGVPALAVPAVAAWTRMPWHFFLMTALVVLAGSLAGARGAPAMLWLTPFYAALLGVAAQEGMRRPVLGPRPARGLGAAARTVAAATLADVRPGETRDLLARIVHLGDRLVALEGRIADVDDLVSCAAETAREVDLFDGAHATLSAAGDRSDAAERCARMRDDGRALLGRALAALGSLSAASGPEAERARDRLADITRQMESESTARVAAALEVGALLGRT